MHVGPFGIGHEKLRQNIGQNKKLPKKQSALKKI